MELFTYIYIHMCLLYVYICVCVCVRVCECVMYISCMKNCTHLLVYSAVGCLALDKRLPLVYTSTLL